MRERVLIVHNAYQNPGGEDSVVESEIALLLAHGHAVETYFRTNTEVPGISRASLAVQALWSSRTTHDVAQLIRSFRPDVIHAHNIVPLVSPALYWVAGRLGVPVVQTLHNFRLSCLNAVFLRDGKACEECLGNLPWRGVTRACYRGSRAESAVLAGMLILHRGFGTYRNKVARYIALNEFCRNKFIKGGLPADRVVVKPNYVDFSRLPERNREGLLFAGRLSDEKGVQTLASAASLLPNANLRVAGGGPGVVKLKGLRGVSLLGHLSRSDLHQEMSKAVALVVPSLSETFGLVIVEAFASGTPVIASRIEAFAGLVEDGGNGLFFEPDNPHDLADKIAWAIAHSEKMAVMGQKARSCYEQHYTAERNYEQLLAIYNDAIDEGKKQRTRH
jgi:glycosyltransferase involved in cell wall biosynthesis